MIEDAVARIQAIELQLKEKSRLQLQARLTIRGCLKELRGISGHQQPVSPVQGDERQSIYQI